MAALLIQCAEGQNGCSVDTVHRTVGQNGCSVDTMHGRTKSICYQTLMAKCVKTGELTEKLQFSMVINSMSQRKEYEWAERFKAVWMSFVDDARSGRPSNIICGDVKEQTCQRIRDNRRAMFDKIVSQMRTSS
jgi:hypothetical protein